MLLIPFLTYHNSTCGVFITKSASTKLVDLDMDIRKSRRQANRLPALESLPDSWDILHQGSEESIIVKHPNETRETDYEYPLAQLHGSYRNYINARARAFKLGVELSKSAILNNARKT